MSNLRRSSILMSWSKQAKLKDEQSITLGSCTIQHSNCILHSFKFESLLFEFMISAECMKLLYIYIQPANKHSFIHCKKWLMSMQIINYPHLLVSLYHNPDNIIVEICHEYTRRRIMLKKHKTPGENLRHTPKSLATLLHVCIPQL